MLSPFGRKLKQINVFFGFLIFLVGIAALIYFLVAPAPSDEELKSIEIKNLNAQLQEDENPSEPPFTYLVSVQLKNPNEKFFVEKLNWVLEATDSSGKTINKISGKDSLKEGEEKTIQKEIILQKESSALSFKIIKANWAQQK